MQAEAKYIYSYLLSLLYMSAFVCANYIATDFMSVTESEYRILFLFDAVSIAFLWHVCEKINILETKFSPVGIAGILMGGMVMAYSVLVDPTSFSLRLAFGLLFTYFAIVYSFLGTMNADVIYLYGGFLDRNKGASLLFFLSLIGCAILCLYISVMALIS